MVPYARNNVDIENLEHIATQFIKYYLQSADYYPILLSGSLGAGKSIFVKFCLNALQLLSTNQEFASPSFTIIKEYMPVARATHNANLEVRPPASQEVRPPASQKATYTASFDGVVYHIDLYRTQSVAEVEQIGFYDLLASNICFVEWPEKINFNINAPYFKLTLEIISEYFRNITITLER